MKLCRFHLVIALLAGAATGCQDVTAPGRPVGYALRTTTPAGDEGAETSTQGCVRGGVCALDPLLVESPPTPPSDCATPGWPGYEGDGTTTPTSGSNGGGATNPPSTTQEPADDETTFCRDLG